MKWQVWTEPHLTPALPVDLEAKPQFWGTFETDHFRTACELAVRRAADQAKSPAMGDTIRAQFNESRLSYGNRLFFSNEKAAFASRKRRLHYAEQDALHDLPDPVNTANAWSPARIILPEGKEREYYWQDDPNNAGREYYVENGVRVSRPKHA